MYIIPVGELSSGLFSYILLNFPGDGYPLTLVMPKYCSHLTLVCIDNHHLFLQCNAVIVISTSCVKTDRPGHLLSQIHIESHSNVNLFPVFYLKAYLCYTEPFRKKSDGSHVYSLYILYICARKTFSWIRTVLGDAKAHVCHYPKRCCSVLGFCS